MSKIKFSFVKVLLVVLVFTLAFLLRFLFIKYNFSFSSELAGDLLDFKNALEKGTIPLLGPHSGTHPWLYFSPLYYWLFIPVVKIFGFYPTVFAFSGLAFSLITLGVNFYVANKYFKYRLAVISTLIMALSPLWIDLAKDARFYALATLLFYPFVISLRKYWDKKTESIFWPFFFLTLALTFHYSVLVIYPVIVIFLLIKKEKLTLKHLLEAAFGIVLPFVPFIVLGQGFKMISDLIIWAPYRLGGFTNLYPKNNPTWESFLKSLEGITGFIGKTFLFDPRLNTILAVIFLAILVYGFIKIIKKRKKDFWLVLAISTLFCGFAAAIIHGGFIPVHYFIFLSPVMVWATAFLIEDVFKSKKTLLKILLCFIALEVLFSNLLYLMNVKQIYLANKAVLNPHFIPLALQQKVADYIVNDAAQNKFSLERVGPFDYYQYDYAQNYKYLMWILGNEPAEEAKLKYTIYEDISGLSQNQKDVYFIENIGILKGK